MKGKIFFNSISNSRTDFLKQVLDIIKKHQADYCLIGGLAVNAFTEPVVSLDLDLVVTSEQVGKITSAARAAGLKVACFKHSVNFSSPGSDLRVQLQTDSRYQKFIRHAKLKTVLGYRMKVASLEDVLAGKLWAYADETRRPSKRQKDLADILRLVEMYPRLEKRIPTVLRKKLRSGP